MADNAHILDFEAARASRTSRTARTSRASRTTRSSRTAQGTRASQADAPRDAKGTHARHASETSHERRRRAARKRKADRQYERTIGRAEATAADMDAGPRAAVYKTQMGASHRRAARMQASKGERGRFSGFAFDLDFSRFSFSRVATWRIAVIACIVFSIGFLYPAAQDYYAACRDEAKAQATLDAAEAKNELVQQKIDNLSTDEGMEDRARTQYGWVKNGEVAVTVSGLGDVEGDDDASALIGTTTTAPETWYSGIGDIIFGYEG